MQFAKHRNDQDVGWLQGNKRFERIDWDTANLIKTVTGADIKFEEKGESVNMWVAWENGINQARSDGFANGRSIGFADGRSAGYADGQNDGFASGRDSAMVSNIKNLMETSGWDARRTMEALKIPANERERYAKQI